MATFPHKFRVCGATRNVKGSLTLNNTRIGMFEVTDWTDLVIGAGDTSKRRSWGIGDTWKAQRGYAERIRIRYGDCSVSCARQRGGV